MKNLFNQIGITFLSLLLASATCNNSKHNDAENTMDDNSMAATETSITEPAPVAADTIPAEKRDTVEIVTNKGNIVVVLYNETPLHRDNFLKLVNSHFYDSIQFHRVIRGFMIQTGDPNSKDADPSNDGAGGPGYTIPAEINYKFHHNMGTLAAARTDNPEKASSGSQFYICHAAAPWLDGQYTIFGETIKGLDVVDQIATVKTGPNDRPLAPIVILKTTHLNAPKDVQKDDKKKKSKTSK